VGNPRDKLIVRPWPHDKVIARVLSKSDLADNWIDFLSNVLIGFIDWPNA
jgi:hypothetical protein